MVRRLLGSDVLVDGPSDSALSGVHAGVSANCPLILQGKCNGHPVVILIDSGATHDFVAQKFVSRQVPSEGQELHSPHGAVGGWQSLRE